MVYLAAKVQSLKLSAVYVQIFHNNQSGEEGKAYISEQVEHEDEYTWSVTKGADLTVKAKFSINVPLIYQFSTEFSTTLKTSSGSTRVETRTTRQLIKQDIKIPPGATIEAKWYVNEAQVVRTSRYFLLIFRLKVGQISHCVYKYTGFFFSLLSGE